MSDRSSLDDAQLLEHFEQASLTVDQFSHRAHVRVAWILLRRDGFDGAMEALRAGLPRLLTAFGIADTPTQGYHETTTQAFLILVDTTMRAYESEMASADSDAFCEAHPQLLSSKILRLYYAPEHRMKPETKHRFLEPDLAPLPRWPAR